MQWFLNFKTTNICRAKSFWWNRHRQMRVGHFDYKFRWLKSEMCRHAVDLDWMNIGGHRITIDMWGHKQTQENLARKRAIPRSRTETNCNKNRVAAWFIFVTDSYRKLRSTSKGWKIYLFINHNLILNDKI